MRGLIKRAKKLVHHAKQKVKTHLGTTLFDILMGMAIVLLVPLTIVLMVALLWSVIL